ncbi:TonB-dependent receptor, partial [bacterium]|nr:TonB-dependent receptor [bacterium]
RRLPAGVTWHLRVAWRTLLDGRELELHVRADNLFDQRVDFQTGLPAPGRRIGGGLTARW